MFLGLSHGCRSFGSSSDVIVLNLVRSCGKLITQFLLGVEQLAILELSLEIPKDVHVAECVLSVTVRKLCERVFHGFRDLDGQGDGFTGVFEGFRRRRIECELEEHH